MSLYAWAENQGLLPEGYANPARIARYREQSRERFLTGEELGRFGDALRLAETTGLPWQHIDNTSLNARHIARPDNRRTVLDPFAIGAIRILMLTGARLNEILHARWEHVDFERGIIFLPDSKTGRKPIFLSEPALAVLKDLPRIAGNPHVFPGKKDGKPRADLDRPWQAVTNAAGLDDLRIHDLRHSFASVAAGASLGLPVIGKLLGHSQAATTQRYAQLADDPMRAAVETIGETISAAMAGRKLADG